MNPWDVLAVVYATLPALIVVAVLVNVVTVAIIEAAATARQYPKGRKRYGR